MERMYPWRATTCGNVVRTVRHTPSRFTSIVRSNASGSIVATVPKGAIPALAITTSMPPKRSTVASTARCSASQSVTSASNQAAFGPISAATCAQSSGSRPTSDDLRAPLPQTAGRLGADTPRGAGDQHDLVANVVSLGHRSQ